MSASRFEQMASRGIGRPTDAASLRRDHHREKDAQINIRCTPEQRMRITAGAAKAYELAPTKSEWGWRQPFSFARWAIDTLLAAADVVLKPKPAASTKKKPAKKKPAKRKAARRGR